MIDEERTNDRLRCKHELGNAEEGKGHKEAHVERHTQCEALG